jgi:hypothetical protein
VAACLAWILRVPPEEVPVPPAGHPEPWTLWRTWLAERGVGLVSLRDPAAFAWPGPWLALLRSAGGGRAAVVAYGSPPGIAWRPRGGPEGFADVDEGYLVAPADVALWAPTEAPAPPRLRGRVEAIALAGAAGAPMTVVGEATVRAGRGLEGDRYFAGRGTFSNPHANGHELTLIEAEAVEDLGLIRPEEARRNVVTRGIDLNALVGRRFTIGGTAFVGRRLCEPCAHLQRLTVPGILPGLVHRGGLRADALGDGTIRIGDPLESG